MSESKQHQWPSAALKGVTVLDLTRARAGPTCARQLADWGADVIKIDEPASRKEAKDGTGQRDFSPRFGPDFQNLHRNKRSLTLNLKSPEGVAVFHRMAKRADMVVENYRPAVKDRLGIGYEAMKQLNPRLIYVSISGYGQDGPYRDRPGVDPIVQGMSGIMSVTGEPGRGPMRAGIAFIDTTAGLFGAMGALTALYEREKSGLGQWVQTSLLQSAVFMLDFQGSRYVMKGEVAQQEGNNHPSSAPIGMFKARDGHLIVSPLPTMWTKFCETIGRPELAADPRYATNKERVARREEVNAIVDEYCSRFEREVLIQRFNTAGIPCGPVNSIDQTFADPQVRHLGIARTLQSEQAGKVGLLAQPFTLDRTPSTLTTPAPGAGEHTDEVLGQFGFSRDEIGRLTEGGVV